MAEQGIPVPPIVQPVKPPKATALSVAAQPSEAEQAVQASSRAIAASKQATALPPMFPLDGEDTNIDDNVVDEFAAIELREAELRKLNEEARLKVADQFIFLVRCRKSHPRGASSHGIYLKTCPFPGQAVKMSGWNAGYKRQFSAAYFGTPICQSCWKHGQQRNTLDVVSVGEFGDFVCSTRWLYARPKDLELAREVGEFRCHDTGVKVSDEARGIAIKKLAAKGIYFDAAVQGVNS